jgi:succinate dehydrogenase/fumarate reductase-like Fe-S protein
VEDKFITVRIHRFNAKADPSTWYQDYQVQTSVNMSVQGLIKHIHDNMDRTLAYRNVGCFLGVCLGCLMEINGKELRACSIIVRPGDNVSVGPAKKSSKVIRDLVVDFG